jgi:hypothetical protein
LLVEGKDYKLNSIKEDDGGDRITWYLGKRICLECEGKLGFVKDGSEFICDSCMKDIGAVDAYVCKECKEFALCNSCAECKQRHLLDNAKGKPPQYLANMNPSCARCGR